jgi:hypothetical protein
VYTVTVWIKRNGKWYDIKKETIMNESTVESLKEFNWQKIIDYANSLSDLNDAQLRFAKGLAIETAVEKFSNSDLTYVGEKHRDYVWPSQGDIDAELKSLVSQSMYNQQGNVKTLPSIRLNNSMGTNKSDLDPDSIADILIAVLKDGAFAVSKDVVLAKARHHGDGWELKLTGQDIVEISGPIVTKNKYNLKLSESIRNAIKESISNL